MKKTKRRPLTPEEQAEAKRLSDAWLAYKDKNKGATQTWLAAEAGLGTQGSVGQYLLAVIPLNIDALVAICRVLGVNPQTISPRLMEPVMGVLRLVAQDSKEHGDDRRQSPGRRAADFALVSADDTDEETGSIEYWEAKGSCGGGFLNFDALPKGHLIKEASFFRKYDLKPGDAFAIYADGSSMANFIVDGDLVIFDKSKSAPRTNEIFAIEHPDGLRIKRLRRGIDGAWVLESDNPDKTRYPDERITPSQGELLKIVGQFVYRQGG